MTAVPGGTLGAAPSPGGAVGAFAAWLAALTGVRRAVAAALFGALATLALPPAHAVPLLWVVVPALLWLLRGARAGSRPLRAAFWTGWWFAFGHFTVGLYWISVSLWVDIARFWWALPLSVAALPALLSAIVGAAAALHAWACRRFGLRGLGEALAFAVLWTVAEWVRGHLFTGFPWNLIGYAWTPVLPVLQTVAVVGIYGLGLITVAVAALPTALADGSGRRAPLGATVAGLGLIALLGGLGAWRMQGTAGLETPGMLMRVVQPNIPQTLKWQAEIRARNLQTHIDLSQSAGWERVTHIVWPETAVPYFPERDAWVAEVLGRVAPSGGYLLTGIPRLSYRDGEPLVSNSLIAVDDAGRIRAGYDKSHLVPFGEYLPFRSLLPKGFTAVAAVGLDTRPGDGPTVVALPGLPPFAPQICYESIFPGAVAPHPAEGAVRAAWLLNITNDAWYGNTAGPHQHFAIARVRAVEEGAPLVRSANTGISGVVDAYGRVVASLPLGVSGVLDVPLPLPTAAPPPYARYGDWGLLLLLSFVIAGLGSFARRV